MRNRASNRRYPRLRRNLEKCFVQKLWREKANKHALTATSYGADGDISPEISKIGHFLVLSKSNDQLQATWHSKTASY